MWFNKKETIRLNITKARLQSCVLVKAKPYNSGMWYNRSGGFYCSIQDDKIRFIVNNDVKNKTLGSLPFVGVITEIDGYAEITGRFFLPRLLWYPVAFPPILLAIFVLHGGRPAAHIAALLLMFVLEMLVFLFRYALKDNAKEHNFRAIEMLKEIAE